MSAPPAPPVSEATPAKRSNRLALVAATIAVMMGLWLLADAMGLAVPSLARYWPAFLIIGGLVSFADYLWLSRAPRSAGQGTLGICLGMLAFSMTLGWTRFLTFWDWFPGVPVSIGLAFLATWLAGGRRRAELLLVGAMFTILGLVGFAVRYPVIRNILPSGELVWALLLLVGGGFALWRMLAARR